MFVNEVVKAPLMADKTNMGNHPSNADGVQALVEQIADIVSCTNTCGANLSLREMCVEVHISFDTCQELSCADAIRPLLR
jgi:hypothetical protein